MKAASLVALISAWAVVPVVAAPITSAPAHYYNFDAGSGTVAVDSGSVGGANATLTAATWSTNTPVSYAGNGSLTTTGTGVQAPAFSLAAQSTISLWAYWGGPTTSPQYLLDSGTSATRTLVYWVDSANATLIAYGGSFFSNPFTQPTTFGWQNIVLARNGTSLKVYQNGALKSTQTLTQTGAFNPGTWYFGQRFNATERLKGQIDEYSFWNQELDAAQISSLYANGTAALFVPEPGTAALSLLALLGVGLARVRGGRPGGPRPASSRDGLPTR